METGEENLPEEFGENPLQDESIEQAARKPRFVKILVRTGLQLVLISVFLFFIVLIFMSHTYSYHL